MLKFVRISYRVFVQRGQRYSVIWYGMHARDVNNGLKMYPFQCLKFYVQMKIHVKVLIQ